MATFFDRMNGNRGPGNPFQNFQDMMRRFNEFTRGFQGDPKQSYEQLMSSGKVTKEQVDRVNDMVNQFSRMIGGRR